MRYARSIFAAIVLMALVPIAVHAQPKPAREAVAAKEATKESPKPEMNTTPATVPNVETDPADFAALLYKSVKDGNWAFAAALAVIGLVWVARKYSGILAERVKSLAWMRIFSTDRGGAALALGLGVAGGVANALLAGTMDVQTLLKGIEVGILAAGGFTVVKKLLWPKDMPNAGLSPIR